MYTHIYINNCYTTWSENAFTPDNKLPNKTSSARSEEPPFKLLFRGAMKATQTIYAVCVGLDSFQKKIVGLYCCNHHIL